MCSSPARSSASWFSSSHISRRTAGRRSSLRLAGGVVGFYAGMEAGSAAMQLGHRIAGLEVPPDAARASSGEARVSSGAFGGTAWSATGFHGVFRPLARRRRPTLGLVAASLVSAAVHAWIAGAALDVRTAILVGAYFIIAMVVVMVEPHLGVRQWPPVVARIWTSSCSSPRRHWSSIRACGCSTSRLAGKRSLWTTLDVEIPAPRDARRAGGG